MTKQVTINSTLLKVYKKEGKWNVRTFTPTSSTPPVVCDSWEDAIAILWVLCIEELERQLVGKDV